jgi:hypothetical protein
MNLCKWCHQLVCILSLEPGYEVVLLTHDPYRELVLGEGLEFFAIGGNPRTIVDRVMNQDRVGEKPNEFELMRKAVPARLARVCGQGCRTSSFPLSAINLSGVSKSTSVALVSGRFTTNS